MPSKKTSLAFLTPIPSPTKPADHTLLPNTANFQGSHTSCQVHIFGLQNPTNHITLLTLTTLPSLCLSARSANLEHSCQHLPSCCRDALDNLTACRAPHWTLHLSGGPTNHILMYCTVNLCRHLPKFHLTHHNPLKESRHSGVY
ncbi:hypothetical protein COCSUDRAFT_34543 [Coccomyxa subellipsoidea C-169]|uniref:Uncharacterized protein n=1 Tax=Coccomyxa subellipsoidea (strain C-169) TaxID=574566 RepID=I0YIY7_COCSC|nr:hypothetical protein COCSUDRAFT_34543 [Coccomyxa subellipsoidea C-169]EIE18356.1 hypothetical protein COCSUDRAFT_34543 [Coccomyxa subellipsoidea C-169]|eukprot:XP_005642900.1 hypothetical protein COCSUDRAFT_34543 [Coccomyxa subellipsoidea C-169]